MGGLLHSVTSIYTEGRQVAGLELVAGNPCQTEVGMPLLSALAA